MNRQFAFLLSLMFLFLTIPSSAGAQAWNGILDRSRAIDWRNVGGVTFTIPSANWTQCGSTISAPSSAAAINAAIASCGANHYVQLGSGTFTLSSCIDWAGHSFVELRGSGPLSTVIKFNSGCNGFVGGTDVNMRASSNIDSEPASAQPGGSSALTLTGTAGTAIGGLTGPGLYPQGATQITVSGVGSDTPHVGTLLIIDQADDTAPNSGWLQCETNTSGSACSENGNSNGRHIGGVYYEQAQVVRITNIAGSTYTISPGLYANNIRSGQTPGAYWNTSSALCTQCGAANLTFDHQSSGSGDTESILVWNCFQCWFRNIRNIWSGTRNHFFVVDSAQLIIRDSYLFGTLSTSSGGGYGVDIIESSDSLVENNIFDQLDSPIVFENGSGWILGYNYTLKNVFINTNWTIDMNTTHDSGSHMNLWEGNNVTQLSADTQHGPSPAITYFRNNVNGNAPVPNDKTSFTTPIELQSYNRGFNIIGNTFGMITCVGGTYAGRPADESSQCTGGTLTGPSWQTAYQNSPGTGCPAPTNGSNAIYHIGWPGSSCASTAGNLLSDTGVEHTLVRWGNYDTATASVHWTPAEATTIAGVFLPMNFTSSYFNTLSHTLPASLYYNSKPSWYASAYGNPPWPPIGPDVTGGNLVGLGGHAYKIPARLCYENTAQDSTNYPGTLVLRFDASACYGSGSASDPPPIAPTNITAIVH